MLLAVFSVALAGPLVASSVLKDGKGTHPADMAFDGLLREGWAEGEMGHGAGSWVEIDLGKDTPLEEISVWPGNLSEGAKSFREYARPKLIRVLVDGTVQGEPVRIQDEIQRVDIPLETRGRKIRVEFPEVFDGIVFADMFVAEVAVNFTEGERARNVGVIEKWREGKEAAGLAKRYDEEILERYTTHKEDPDHYESLVFLMHAAGDGPEYLRRRVSSLVPAGFRAAAILPDDMAMQAIKKLRDPNGIPGLEMAALRALGKQQAEIRDTIDYFYAWQELQGGGRRNIESWGVRGFEVGGLQSFGEPIPIEIDTEGNAWVADTANNRVQRFNPSGISDKQLGAPKDVSQRWFGKKRKWYAAGSAASEEPGGFVNPVDIEVLPGKDGDRFVVLDAAGRLQIFDAEGVSQIGWNVRVDDQIQPKVGGEGYLAYLPKQKRLVAILGNEAVTFDLASEELTRWRIPDGTPNGVDVGPDSRIYMVFGPKVVTFNPDGFRYGTVVDQKQLGAGYEDCDITFDEKGALWALTDRGWVVAFKSPGKVDWKLKISGIDLERPRLAVRQGQVLYTDRDRILPVDALQMHVDEVEAAKEAEEQAKLDAKSKQ